MLLWTVLVAVGLGAGPGTEARRLPHIVRGRNAQVGEFPWQASFRLFGSHACGAALVTDRWLITAAHCIGIPPARDIVLGAHDIITMFQGQPKVYSIKTRIMHPQWDDDHDMGQNDIALLELNEPVGLGGKYVKAIRPAPADVGDLVGAECIISGWGKMRIGSKDSANILQAAETTPMSNGACAQEAAKIPDTNITIVDSHICVGGFDTVSGCHGDSGGPLSCLLPDGTVVLAGVTSGGDRDCNPRYPSIYTRISAHRQWLADNSNGEIAIDL